MIKKDTKIVAHILTALHAGQWGVSGEELARDLGVSRAAIWAHIEELRAIGYDIEAGPHLGYRLLSVPDVLHADEMYARLGRTRVFGREIQVFEATTSTNDLMARLGRAGVKEGVVIFAESQSKGRGRLGRRWISPARKGLWFSVLLRPDMQPQAATQLTIAAATALARAIAMQTGIVPEIKWPNDILIRGKKIAGILTEMSAELDHLKEIILGIGIDVNQEAGEFPATLRKTATSIRIESGQLVDRAGLAVAILRELDGDYERIKRGEFEIVAEQWREHCSTIGSHVSIRVGDRVVRGRAEALDADGALLLRGPHGHLERIIGGDVTTEK
jgi:BirA family biotin operon repressor/biotin-[acetyl-CoA-carboxylase] ligase